MVFFFSPFLKMGVKFSSQWERPGIAMYSHVWMCACFSLSIEGLIWSVFLVGNRHPLESDLSLLCLSASPISSFSPRWNFMPCSSSLTIVENCPLIGESPSGLPCMKTNQSKKVMNYTWKNSVLQKNVAKCHCNAPHKSLQWNTFVFQLKHLFPAILGQLIPPADTVICIPFLLWTKEIGKSLGNA